MSKANSSVCKLWFLLICSISFVINAITECSSDTFVGVFLGPEPATELVRGRVLHANKQIYYVKCKCVSQNTQDNNITDTLKRAI